MMLQQQEKGVKPPDGSAVGKGAKQRSGLVPASLSGSKEEAITEQQAQRCPRCDSLNTKFCYYNNYSLSQPRHFCKNCRRYWTRGGTLRNVPVGGGCRKNKRLKHRDPSCLAAFEETEGSGSTNMLASISGCGIAGFGSSASSLIQDLAREGQRQFVLSRLAGMPVFENKFMMQNEHSRLGGSSAQDLFTVAAGSLPSPLLSPFDPSAFPGLSNYAKPADSQSLLFHDQQTSREPGSFFEPINVTSPSLTSSLEQFAVAPAPPATHPNYANTMRDGAGVTSSQLSLIDEDTHLKGIHTSHHETHTREGAQQRIGQANATRNAFTDGNVENSMAMSKDRSLMSSLSDWATGGSTNLVQQAVAAGNTDTHVGGSGLWNASWPEMQAALAGSAAAAGAMLH